MFVSIDVIDPPEEWGGYWKPTADPATRDGMLIVAGDLICRACDGFGYISDRTIPCPDCRGRRYLRRYDFINRRSGMSVESERAARDGPA